MNPWIALCGTFQLRMGLLLETLIGEHIGKAKNNFEE